MIFIKYIILVCIFGISTSIGFILSKKTSDRVKELKEFKKATNMIENKMKFTYEPLGEIFNSISKTTCENISAIFKAGSKNLKEENIKNAWKNAIELNENYLHINQEDKNIILSLGNSLGKTDVDGQVSELKLVKDFLDIQILKAEDDRRKNEKMYKSLGYIIGIAIVIILI